MNKTVDQGEESEVEYADSEACADTDRDDKQVSPPEDGEQDETAADETEEHASPKSAEELQELLDEANEQVAEMKDGYIRAKAEVENIRRRSQNEVVAARKYAIEGFAQELLSIKDSLDQAARVELEEGSSEAVANMKEGLELTLRQFDAVMGKFAVAEVEAGPGVRFDPDLHQAISMVPSEEIEADHIVSVMQKGFMLKDRLLRPAMVVVAQG